VSDAKLSSETRAAVWLITLILWAIGTVLIIPELSWRGLAGLFFVIWANNLQQRTI
jgi:hypothetical protein